jgi:septum formation protein
MSALILASASPRRAQLLRAAGLNFQTCPSRVDEGAIQASTHRDYAIKAALSKAQDVLEDAEEGSIVIGADTIVCLDEKRLGKPADRAEAREMLQALESRRHVVMTGLAVCRRGRPSLQDCVETAVWFGPIPPEDLEACLDTPEPYDKAGAYAIQGWAANYVERIEGDWHNVVGLPVARLLEMLGEFIDVSGAYAPPLGPS